MVKNLRIWLGGSFDPVHLGHLAIIEHIAKTLNAFLISEKKQQFNITLSLLPTAHNPLKPNPTENFHRLAMLELALENLKTSFDKGCMQYAPTPFNINFQIDTSEIYQTDTVFTFNTFSNFREKYPDDSLIFVLGMDSILAFERWYRAYELPTLCHLWVMPRLGELAKNAETLPEKLQPFLTDNIADLITANNGRIYLDKFEVMSVSSSHIRAILQDKTMSLEDKKSLLQSFLNPNVLAYILEHGLYQFPKNSL